MNTPLHDFAIEALKINTFLEEYITSAEIRLSYVLGILGGHPHPEEVQELVGGPGAADAVERRARARGRKQEADAVARRDRYKPVRAKPGVPKAKPEVAIDTSSRSTPSNETARLKALARARYDDWSDDVVIGDIKDTDQVIEIVGAGLFKNHHSARITVGIMLRTDPIRWRQLMAKAGGPRRRWGGSAMWERIDGPTADAVRPRRSRSSNSVGAEA